MISLTILAAIFWRQPSSTRTLKNSSARRTGGALIVGSDVPPTKTNRAAFVRRAPSHSGQRRVPGSARAPRARRATRSRGSAVRGSAGCLRTCACAARCGRANRSSGTRPPRRRCPASGPRGRAGANSRKAPRDRTCSDPRAPDHLVVIGVPPVPAAHRAVRERDWPSGTTSAMSSSTMLPKPWQVGQAPKGLLNEKSRGSSSDTE